MRKLYSLLLLTAALICLPWSVKAATTVFSEGFEGDLSNWTTSGAVSNTGIYSTARTGSKGFRFYYGYSNQYLISNELSIPSTAIDVNVEFYYKKHTSGTETFKVGYSTTDNDPASFTWDTEITASNTSWLKYTPSDITFPIEIKYFAICYTSYDKYYLYIDDIELTCNVSGPSMAVLDGETALTSGHSQNFGLATAGTTKVFTLKNDGTEPTPVAVAHTGDFGVELSAASIPAGGSVDLTVTMPATSGSDVITISSTSEAIADFTLNVSGTIRDPNKLWCNFSEGLPEGWTHSSYTFMTSGAGEGTSGGGYATQSAYGLNRLSTPKVVFAENEKLLLLVSSTSSWSTGTMEIQYSANGTNWTTAKTVSSIANGHWTSVEVTEIPAGTWYIGFNGQYVYVTDIYGGTPAALVKNVAASAITDTEATISWTAHGSETAWQVSYSTTSGDPDNGTIVEATSTSKVLEGLTATTTYYVSVRIGDSGVWSNEISFTTACGAVDAPIKWTFEGLSDGTVPSCWDNSGSGTATTGSYLWSTYKIYNTSIYTLRLYNAMVQGGTALINTPSIILPAAPAAYEFAFEYSHKASCGEVSIMVSDDSGENWTKIGTFENESGSTGTSPDEFTEKVIDLTSYAGKTIILQFFAEADYNLGAIFVKNVEIRAKSNCPAPKSVLVSNVTANTATVAWTEKGEATAWKLQTSTNGTDWSDEIAANANPFTLTGLTAQTTYYVRVKAVCSELESSDWSDASDSFNTKCEAKALPFSEDFTGESLPDCWETTSYGNGNGQWYIYSNSARFNARVNSSTSVDLNTPSIVLTDVAELSFAHEGTSVTAEVYVNTGEGEVLLQSIPKTSATEKIDLSAYKNQTVSFTFRAYGYSAYSTVYFYLDDVKVDYAPVAAPTNLVAEAGNASATITWAAVEGAASYNLRWREKKEEPAEWTVENLTANTKSLTELTNGKTYEVQVQAVASANRKSDWTASATFTPVSCPTVTAVTFGAATYNSVVVNWTASAASTWALRYKTDGDWTVASSAIENQTYTLTGLTANTAYTIAVKPTCGDDEAWVEAAGAFTPVYTKPSNVAVASITDVAATASWNAVADAAGYKVAVALRGETPEYSDAITKTDSTFTNLRAATEYDFYVAAVYGEHMEAAEKVEFATVTIAPKNLTLSAVTATTATLSWENDGTATKYEWATGEDHTALSWNEVETNTKTLESLTANTSYTFYVRSKYANDATSDSIKLTFRTECAAIATESLPWFEGFENLETGTYTSAAPNCWAQINVNSGRPYAYVATKTDWKKTGSKSMYIESSGSRDGYIILPEFEAALNTLQISFSHKEESTTKSAELTLGYITDIADAETFQPIQVFTRSTSWQEEKEVSLASVPEEAATARLAFKLGKATDQWYSGIDDITVSKLPSCSKPVIGETTILPDGATFTWTAGHGEEHFQYAVDTTETLVWTATDALTATVHGLTPGNNYKFYVRAFCDPEVSDSVFTAFVPVCPAPTALDVETAEQTTATFSWTAAEGISEYQYLVVERGETADWTQAQKTVSTSAAWDGLEANTAYTFYVRSFYSEIAQSAAISLDFRTECAAVAELSWSENFEGQTLNAAPACWTLLNAQDASTSTYPYIAVKSESGYYQDTQALFFRSKADYGYAILPEFSVALSNAQITFSHKEESATGNLVFGYLTDIADASTFHAILECTASSTWKTESAVALTDVPAGARLAFKHNNAGQSFYYDAAVDNILIETIPACVVPTGLAASEITASGATIAWTSTAENFALELKQGEGEWLPVDATITNPFVLEGLQENTTYSVRVKAVCGEESESEFCDAIDFTTDCAVRTMPYTPDLSASLPECWTFTGKSGGWKIANSALRYEKNTGFAGAATLPTIHVNEANYPIIRIEYSNKSGQNKVDASISVVADDVDSTYTLAEHSSIALMELDLAKFKGKDVTITINVASGACVFDVETFQVINKPLFTPQNVAAQAGDGQATITWEAGGNEIKWQLYYNVKGEAEATWSDELTEKTYTITGLTNGVTYCVHVKGFYEIGGWTVGSDVVEFTPSKSTGVENAEAECKAVKVIENGQLMILHNGAKYNALGEKIQ